MDEAPIPHRRRRTPKRRSKPAPTTFMSIIHSLIHTILTYTSLLIITAFTLIQAMEAITFILGFHTGLVWKALWVAYLCMVAFTVIAFIDVQRGNEAERQARGDVREAGWREILWG